MTVTSVDKDYDNLTVTLIADFDAPIDRVWDLWSDPRKLERWMGPPGYPATVGQHDLTAGGQITLTMTGPDGDTSAGIWEVTAVDPPTSLDFTDTFTDADGTPMEDVSATRVSVRLTERDGGTRMEVRSRYETREDMEQRVEMGEVEGWQQALSQMDPLLDGGA